MADTPAAAPAAPASPAPAAPAAAAPAPVLTAPDAGASLIDGASAAPAPAAPAAPAAAAPTVSLAEAQRIVEAARLAAQPNSGAAWNLTDTIPGVGEKPGWFKSDKYKNVTAQAEAYTELEKRFGGFTGAPKDGYVIPKVEVDGKPVFQLTYGDEKINVLPDHPILQEFNKTAAEMQLSQEGYNKFLGLMAHYVASLEPDMAEQRAALGPNADARVTAVANWAKNNLDANGFELFRTATSGENAAVNFALMEQLIAKTGTVRLPAPGDDIPQPTGVTRETIVAMQGKKNEKGQRLYDIDPNYRKQVEQAWTQFFAVNPVQRDRQGNLRG